MLDRELQKRLLKALYDIYPAKWKQIIREYDEEHPDVVTFNLYYLSEHGLVQLNGYRNVEMSYRPIASAGITAKGIDFIQEDGGLSAILGTVMVKLHADTIRDLIEAKILRNEEIPPEEKSSLLKSLRAMPEEAMRQLTHKLIGYGLEQAPSAWAAIIQSLKT